MEESAGSSVNAGVRTEESAGSVANAAIHMEESGGCLPCFPCVTTKKESMKESAGNEESAGRTVNDAVRVEGSAGSSLNVEVCMKENARRIVNAVIRMEERARKCYAGRIDLDGIGFVKMLVIDGCFVIELLRCYGLVNCRDADDPIFRHERLLSQLRHDILLNENQLPFFVLNDLFNMSKSKDPKDDLIRLTLHFVEGMFLDLSVPKQLGFPAPNHLLGLIRDVWVLPFANANAGKNNQSPIAKWENINSASGLQEVGIDFEIAKDYSSLMEIKFVGGKLQIPQLNIYYETESQIRSLVVYEQYLPDGKPRYVSDYTFFLHCLINTSDDVELLCRSGIIGNWLGNDEEVCLMFNRLGKTILTSSKFSYSEIFRDVNMHYHSHRKKWGAKLRRNYFADPWLWATSLAAVVLLLLTAAQTVYTILSHHHPR